MIDDRDDIGAEDEAPVPTEGESPAANPIDETVGMEARIMLKGVRVSDAGPLEAETKARIREIVRTHINERKLTLREVAAQVGIGDSTLNEVLRGKYDRADDSGILRKLNAWIDDDERRRSKRAPIGFYKTGVFEAVRMLAQFAKSNARVAGPSRSRTEITQDSPRIVIGWGPAGSGKSLAAAAIYADDPLSVLVRIEQRRGTDIGLAKLICESAGFRSKRREASLVSYVMDKLRDSGRLLIVDEAHRLKLSGCELLRDLADVSGVPILLLCTKEFYLRLTRVRRGAGELFYDQFSSRVGYVCDLIRGIDGKGGAKRAIFSVAEIRAIFKADGVRITSDAIDFLQAVACAVGLGMLRLAASIFEKAVRHASRKGRIVDADLLRRSAERVLIPAGDDDPEIMLQLENAAKVNRELEARAAKAATA